MDDAVGKMANRWRKKRTYRLLTLKAREKTARANRKLNKSNKLKVGAFVKKMIYILVLRFIATRFVCTNQINKKIRYGF